MPYNKIKDENYQNLGGMNTKVSQYITGDKEILNLRNFTFVKPGAWTSRPGTEKYYTLAATGFSLKPLNTIQYTKANGSSFIIHDSGQTLYKENDGALCGSLIPGVTGLPIDYTVQNDRLYFTNGYAFRSSDGTGNYDVNVLTQQQFCLLNFYGSNIVGASGGVTFSTSLTPVNGATVILRPGFYTFWISGARNVSLPPSIYIQQPHQIGSPNGGYASQASLAATLVSKGAWLLYGLTVLGNPGVSLLIPEYTGPGASLNMTLAIPEYNGVVSGTLYPFGQTVINGTTQWFCQFDHFSLTQGQVYDWQTKLDIYPKYLQTFNNMLFAANTSFAPGGGGASQSPNMVWCSRIGEPERFDEESFFEVRTGGGDTITGIHVFQDALMVFKNNSVHEVTGYSPQSLALKDLSVEYGCLNNRSVTSFENFLWFVDKKGIVQYNGANFEVVSDPIRTEFDQVDKTKVQAIHVKKKNQVWFCASQKVFVYDYLIKSWAIYDNLQINSDAGANVIQFNQTLIDVSWWESGASFHNAVRFGDSLTTDQGSPMTLMIKTRFHKRMGESTQELWRRLYINCDVPGSTQGVTINLYPDYGSSIYATKSLFLDRFQKRIDFGISAKSLSVELILSASQTIRINGYTIEARYLRSV